jgi:hypothetical protein
MARILKQLAPIVLLSAFAGCGYTQLRAPSPPSSETVTLPGFAHADRGPGPVRVSQCAFPRLFPVRFCDPWDHLFYDPYRSPWTNRLAVSTSYGLTPRWRIGLGFEQFFSHYGRYGYHPYYDRWSRRVILFASYRGSHWGVGFGIVLYDSSEDRYLRAIRPSDPAYGSCGSVGPSRPPARSVPSRPRIRRRGLDTATVSAASLRGAAGRIPASEEASSSDRTEREVVGKKKSDVRPASREPSSSSKDEKRTAKRAKTRRRKGMD